MRSTIVPTLTAIDPRIHYLYPSFNKRGAGVSATSEMDFAEKVRQNNTNNLRKQ